MTTTVITTNDPKTVKKWSATLAADTVKKSYFEGRFIGTSQNSVIQKKTELETGAGDSVSFDLSVRLRGDVTYGDDRLDGKEEDLKFFTDKVSIDQVRKAVSAGGKMTRKRTQHDLRAVAKDRLGDFFAQFTDELFFIYLSGARGINADFLTGTDYAGFAGNALEAPDSDHILFGGVATSKATLAATDKMGRALIEKLATKARMIQANNPENTNMVPITNGSDKQYVLLMSPYQEYDLRQETGTGGWLDIQKAAAAAEGKSNPIFKGGLGMINNIVLHSHESVIRFSDYGAGSNVKAARALFMGRQAGVVAYGSDDGMRYKWKEEAKDYGNQLDVASGFIAGVKKARFNGKDFGVISADTAAVDPNA